MSFFLAIEAFDRYFLKVRHFLFAVLGGVAHL